MLFIDISATGESAWVLTSIYVVSSEAPSDVDVDLESSTKFLESLDTTTLSDPADGLGS